ncbi:hypothetical protein Ga0102493_11994 [Erythrobacter litoralis]|nr:hypothetical protein Ga0102493_11994 [Erythrobacter litoralis]
MMSLELRLPTSFHQPATAKRKTSIANGVAVNELRPTGTNVVVFKELGRPPVSVKYMPIPLHYQAIVASDVLDQTVEDKI